MGGQTSRFVFLSMPVDGEPRSEGFLWMLMSPNNRPLGRGGRLHDTYAECRDSVYRLREQRDRMAAQPTTVERTGHWTWRLDLDGETVAVSSRSYLRVRECTYNLGRFLGAVPEAEIVDGTRAVRHGRVQAADPAGAG